MSAGIYTAHSMRTGENIAERTTGWTNAERVELAHVVDELRPSARHLTDILDWIDDLAARDGARPGDVLAAPALRTALASGVSAPERLKRWKEALRRLRYPRLSAREEAVAGAIRALALDRTTSIEPPPALEGGVVTVSIRARSAAELAAALARIGDRLARGDIERLFALLEEA